MTASSLAEPVPSERPHLRFREPSQRPRTLVMGILNVTPDSFSDGGRFLDRSHAIERGLAMAAEGADIIDVGGESTRPGARRVTLEEELDRVLPVVEELAARDVTVSIDTMRAAVAQAAVQEGARLVNDVSGGLADPGMAAAVARAGVTYVAMHWRAHSDQMMNRACYGDVVTDVVGELSQRVDALTDAGVKLDQIVLDPGLGFAKTAAHSWSLLANIRALDALGRPVLIGASRKSFLGRALAPEGAPPPASRDDATLAVCALAAAEGVFCVRVHDVGPTVDAVRTAAMWQSARLGVPDMHESTGDQRDE
jgi:dihydropteroate synthase